MVVTCAIAQRGKQVSTCPCGVPLYDRGCLQCATCQLRGALGSDPADDLFELVEIHKARAYFHLGA